MADRQDAKHVQRRELDRGEMPSLKKGSQVLPVKTDRQKRDAETEDDQEARLCQQIEINRGELLWTQIYRTLTFSIHFHTVYKH